MCGDENRRFNTRTGGVRPTETGSRAVPLMKIWRAYLKASVGISLRRLEVSDGEAQLCSSNDGAVVNVEEGRAEGNDISEIWLHSLLIDCRLCMTRSHISMSKNLHLRRVVLQSRSNAMTCCPPDLSFPFPRFRFFLFDAGFSSSLLSLPPSLSS